MTHPIKRIKGDAMDQSVFLRGEAAMARLMGVKPRKKSEPPKLPRRKPRATYDQAEKLRENLLNCIREHGPMPQREMVQKADLDKNAVSYHLSCLISDGLVENPDPRRRRDIQWRAVE